MTLLITIIAAVTVTVIWYTSEKARRLNIGSLCLIYWGAALMWLVDAVTEYNELRAEYFTPAPADMLNDAFLGLSAAALGALIYLVILFVKDPDHVIADHIMRKNEKH